MLAWLQLLERREQIGELAQVIRVPRRCWPRVQKVILLPLHAVPGADKSAERVIREP
jgi:hypothetical protein